MKEGISKGMNMKWSLYMSSNQQNLTIGSIGLKSDYRVVKISLTTGLGSYPGILTVMASSLEAKSSCMLESGSPDEAHLINE